VVAVKIKRRQRFVRREDPIERRILDALIHMVHVRRWKPKIIYLTEADMVRLPPQYRNDQIDGIPVRLGSRSMFYADCRYGVVI
jgi:hypothetical protein